MSKIAFVFSGQGAQFVGMGKEIASQYESADKVFDIASKELGYDIKELCFEGPEDKLKITENTQPAILTASYAMLQAILEAGFKADITAGLSLGEYTANVYAGTMTFEDAVKTVRLRGRYMQEEVAEGVGGMTAVIGLADDVVKKACEDASNQGYVACANFNCPGQVVISGELKALAKAGELLSEAGAKRVIPLKVSAPFHCELLKGAGEKLEKTLKEIPFKNSTIPIVANVTALPYEDSKSIKDNLVSQVSQTVKWTNTIKYMIEQGVDTFVEIGPGKTLSGLIKKTDRSVKIFNVQDIDSLNNTISGLKGE